MKFDWLGVYPVRLHPKFVVIGAQPQLLLLASDHLPAFHAENSVRRHVLAAFQYCLKPLPRYRVLVLRHPLRAKLLCFAHILVDVIALRAERDNPAAFALELEEPGGATGPLVPSQPLFLLRLNFRLQLRPNNVLEPLGRDGNVVAVCVHLDKLEISSVEIPVKKVVIEFEHPQLCQL